MSVCVLQRHIELYIGGSTCVCLFVSLALELIFSLSLFLHVICLPVCVRVCEFYVRCCGIE